MKTISSWLLGGALAASLTWNWKLAARDDDRAVCASTRGCAFESCVFAPDEMPLEAAQKTALDEVCARSCSESDRLEKRADELQHKLLSSLSTETVDRTSAEKLVNEVSELRRRSLASCVEGILGVRSVLSPKQVRALLECCERTSSH